MNPVVIPNLMKSPASWNPPDRSTSPVAVRIENGAVLGDEGLRHVHAGGGRRVQLDVLIHHMGVAPPLHVGVDHAGPDLFTLRNHNAFWKASPSPPSCPGKSGFQGNSRGEANSSKARPPGRPRDPPPDRLPGRPPGGLRHPGRQQEPQVSGLPHKNRGIWPPTTTGASGIAPSGSGPTRDRRNIRRWQAWLHCCGGVPRQETG